MRLRDIMELLNARAYCGEERLDEEVHSAFASDFMSDVLAFVRNQDLLLTGMVNSQVVRTAEMMDIKCIIFVRGKLPDETVVAIARERGIAVLATAFNMFNSSGRLYAAGLTGE
ncbi:hypothetical protein SDC9_70878 [bioreactor metagenome]|uniref:DRTGG domain-containing protein n=1 Tax=bioreactor metagenome TaxID=1076179 RepID=A0A644Y752_9ZZZZ